MASVPPRTERRPARPGSLQRPVNGRLYRGTWLLVGLPLLVAAFSVARPTPLPRAFVPAFDGAATKTLATDLADLPYRQPGSSQALAAASWFRDQLAPYGLPIRTERFSAVIPGRGKVQLQNLIAEASGRSPRTIVVMAHRDNDGRGPGANDNASGTAMLIQLARAYGVPPGRPSAQLRPSHTILFISTDGGAYGGVGAAWFAAHYPFRNDVAGVINLDSVGGSGRVRVEFNGDTPREPSGTFFGDDRSADLRADRPWPGSSGRVAPADRSRLSLLALRTGAVPHAWDRRRHPHDRGRQPSQPFERHLGTSARRQACASRPCSTGRSRDARRESRIHPGNVHLPLSRLAAHPRLGNRARADRVFVALSGNSDRSLCPLQ